MKSSLSKGLSKRFKKPSKDLTHRLLASDAFIGSKKGRKRRKRRLKKKRKSRTRKN